MADHTDAEAELERFRKQWKEEVTQKRSVGADFASRRPLATSSRVSKLKSETQPDRATLSQSSRVELNNDHEGWTYHDLPDKEEALKLGAADQGLARPSGKNEPRSALQHYEQAVESESAGRLGESLDLYRKAFKLDDNVDKKYKSKHFPPSAFKSKASDPNPSNASTTVPGTAHHSLHGPSTTTSLIESFSSLTISRVPPPTEASPAPPCPIADLPSEILTQVLNATAYQNVGAFAKLALVCKRFAYLTTTEEQIWRSVVLSREQGFGDMHYKFACNIFGEPVSEEDDGFILGLDAEGAQLTEEIMPPVRALSFSDITNKLLTSHYASSWRQMYRLRPRIRFHGVYISTVNYTRAGSASPTMTTWSTPVHVVTYYRYLRFYRDGTCISLLTTVEPIDVVHILSKESMPEPQSRDPRAQRRAHHRGLDKVADSRAPLTSLDKAGSAHGHASSSAPQASKTEAPMALPTSQIMKDALRGRWRLSGPGDGSSSEAEPEGDLHVETEGVVPRYTYTMLLGIGGVGKTLDGHGSGKRASRNNRLVWKGYWSTNLLTDDTAAFTLRNDRAFVFSRVKSYGFGG